LADNVAITAGAGTAIAADDISSVFYQRVKIGIGADGSAVDWSEAAPAPVIGIEDVLEVTLSTDTAVYASGEVLADTQEIANAFRSNGRHITITSIVVQDQSDQGYGFDLVFLNANNSLGTENATPSISDTNGTAIIGIVPVGQSDWIDLGAFRIATLMNISLGPIEAAAGSTSLWVGAISRGTGTYAADAIRLKISVVRD
jgi:hypothetical protein